MLVTALYSINNIMKNRESSGTVEVFLEPIPVVENKTAPVYPPTEEKPIKPVKVSKTSWGMYHIPAKIRLSSGDLSCLAKNIFHEAGVEPYIGKVAVAQITYNRVKSGRWGDTFCKVVYAKKQFSWTLIPINQREVPHGPRWHSSIEAAKSFLRGTRVANLEKANHYHATYISPYWNKSMKKSATVGQHVFYADKN
jgi:spore germination cell wall hydrolase CwlJ-like protein